MQAHILIIFFRATAKIVELRLFWEHGKLKAESGQPDAVLAHIRFEEKLGPSICKKAIGQLIMQERHSSNPSQASSYAQRISVCMALIHMIEDSVKVFSLPGIRVPPFVSDVPLVICRCAPHCQLHRLCKLRCAILPDLHRQARMLGYFILDVCSSDEIRLLFLCNFCWFRSIMCRNSHYRKFLLPQCGLFSITVKHPRNDESAQLAAFRAG